MTNNQLSHVLRNIDLSNGYIVRTVNNLEAFYIPKGTFVKLNPLIVHGTQFPVHKEEAHLICLLPGRTFMNDKVARSITNEEEMAELVLE